MTYPSKWSNAIALFAQMNWGVQVLALEPPFFLAEKGGKRLAFQAYVLEDYREKIEISVNKKAEYLCLVFDKKPGANLVLLTMSDVYEIVSKPFTINEIVPFIKVKDQIEISHEEAH